MPWVLAIDTIDVGQGESSLIIARNAAAGQQRTMLIDGGVAGYAQTVHTYVSGQLALLGMAGLDHILLSHYDNDHSGGILALLIADNYYRLCEILAEAAGAAAFDATSNGHNQEHQIAAAAAAAAAAAMGGYNNGAGNNASNVAVNAGQAVWASVIQAGDPNDTIAREGALDGEGTARQAMLMNPPIIPLTTTRRDAAKAAGVAAGTTAGTAAARTAAALVNVFNRIRGVVSPVSQFQTGGIYHDVHIIDIGDIHMPNGYEDVIEGRLTLRDNPQVQLPGLNRTRLGRPNLGQEVLWNSGPAPIAAPANSPAAFVVACRKFIWNAPAQACPIASGQPDNDDSIGLILRFNQFFYYTGGDLPHQGEDLIANAVMAHGLPNPQGGAAFPPPHCIACFKCGHHGSEHSTSQNFLNTVQPCGAIISCGVNQFGDDVHHPEQDLVDRVHAQGSIEYFYLTNCNYHTNFIPATAGNDQLLVAGNKSRVAGENDVPNLQVGRTRGDIRILINEAESTSNVAILPLGPGQVLRSYKIWYFDDDNTALVGHVAVGNRVERIIF